MPQSGATQGATPRWSKTRLCFVGARSGCGCDRAPDKNEATEADSIFTQWIRFFPAMVFVLVLGGIACPFHSVGPLLTRALTHESRYKFCANGQTGSAIFTQHVMVQSVCG